MNHIREEFVKPPHSLPIHQHCINFTLVGSGLTGEEWIKDAEKNGYDLSEKAKSALLSPKYNLEHRITPGREYEVSLILGEAIPKDTERMTVTFKNLAKEQLGEESIADLKGEHALLLLKKLSKSKIELNGLVGIIVPHKFILDPNDKAIVLGLKRREGKLIVGGYEDVPRREWEHNDAFVFVRYAAPIQ